MLGWTNWPSIVDDAQPVGVAVGGDAEVAAVPVQHQLPPADFERVSMSAAGSFPPKRVSWRSWMISRSQRQVVRSMLRLVWLTPYMGSKRDAQLQRS